MNVIYSHKDSSSAKSSPKKTSWRWDRNKATGNAGGLGFFVPIFRHFAKKWEENLYRIKKIAVFLILLIESNLLVAHEIRPAYLRIDQKTDSTYELTWKIPTLGNMVPIIVPVFEEGFVIQEKGFDRLASAAIRKYELLGQESLAGKKIRIDRLEETLIDALVQIQLLNGNSYSFLLQPDNPEKVIPIEPSRGEVAILYLTLGVEHILIGYDHLLFVLGLLLLLSGFGTLLKTITSFTIAHSITLGIAAMGWFALPQAPVEAVIALSILFLAKEYLRLLNGEKSLSAQYPWLVAFIFGLLHGFGFAGALQEIGFPQQDVPLALFTFNVGVELGQILFVALVYLLLFLLKKMKIVFAKWTYKVPPYVMGSVAAFWLIQRVLGF